MYFERRKTNEVLRNEMRIEGRDNRPINNVNIRRILGGVLIIELPTIVCLRLIKL